MSQISLFDLLAAPPPAPSPDVHFVPAEMIHWMRVTTRRAGTACNITIEAYYHANHTALPTEGEKIRVTCDRFDGTVTCPRCLEAMRW
jgi:hypothetical protein